MHVAKGRVRGTKHPIHCSSSPSSVLSLTVYAMAKHASINSRTPYILFAHPNFIRECPTSSNRLPAASRHNLSYESRFVWQWNKLPLCPSPAS